MRILVRWLINAAVLLLLTQIIAGFHVDGVWSAILAAGLVGLLNAIVRPILILLTLPITIVTLGLFTFVINALMLLLASTIIKGFTIEGFVPALLAALILWAVGVLTNFFIRETKET